jgi:hypothetical protein
MKQFEYDITKHPAEQFTQLIYFCTDKGECRYDQLSSDHMTTLTDILNDKGSRGWELVQISFGENGILAFWKRAT